jgi:proteasome lid subunit RPN8/RPN11
VNNTRDVLRWAHEAGFYEACGVTVGGVALALTNVSATPTKNFMVTADDLRHTLAAHDGPWDGVWHSHPDGEEFPSKDDLHWHPKGKALYIVAKGRVLEFDDAGNLVTIHDA